ncbi:TetR/AcrR family transcriptional regulator [Streptomyces sp. MST-110588]|uniref:TetR/AcrR family transcriptional regulator n=1 Tax=Streptomyces sp. MST-110588 TaxID=2833628 RepID=UPI001F5CEEEB|nr:TetR/AcrR family transcriptional regulator [Streptomyces sp. MST-110588]UNO39880.1 TetR/AcrR family transcriptional regulator [Streptomyces sp. MST-110588]
MPRCSSTSATSRTARTGGTGRTDSGGRTGRPRSAEADRAILGATRAALVELGWGKLTMSDVAARAGVAKTTLYRRWANKSELVVDAVAVLFDELELPDRGSLRADIEGVVRQFADLLARPEAKTALMAVVAESTTDQALRERIRTAIVDRQKRLVVQGRQRAQERGELPRDADGVDGAVAADRAVGLIFDVIAGAVVHRALVSAEPVDAVWTGQFTTLLLGGLAGLDGHARTAGPE